MSIRLRLAVVFALAAAVLFTAGGWLFFSALSASLLRSLDSQVRAELGTASRYLPAHGSTAPVGGNPVPGEVVVQVIDPSGRVRGASPDAGVTPLLSRAALSQAKRHQVALITSDEGERERLIAGPLTARPVRPGWVAVAAVSLEAMDSTLSDVTRDLIIAGAVFVAGAGLGAYGLARAALSPVERMRREVASLSARDQSPGIRVPRTRDEIAALAETMNDLLSRLQRALAGQRALVADASHELRTPLAVLRGELELAARPGRSQADLAEAVGHASEEAARLCRTTEQLLLLARADEDRMAMDRRATDIAQLLAGTARYAAARATAAGVRCDVEVPAGLTANVDPDRVREAVDNLVDNSLRFAPGGTAIVIAAAAASRDLTIEVRDSGPGFPAGFLPHAFERFRRPDSGRARASGGAGLGLAIASAIAQAHGGHAVARNQPDGGAAVALWFPGATVRSQPDDQPREPSSLQALPARWAGDHQPGADAGPRAGRDPTRSGKK